MGASDKISDAGVYTVGLQAIREAQQLAAKSGRRVMVELEDSLRMDSREIIVGLGRTLNFSLLLGEELFACTALLDRLPLTEALQRESVAVRTPRGEECVVVADPFDRNRQAWLDERLRGFPLCLTHPADLAAYLGRFEEQTRAIDSVAGNALAATVDDRTVETLSLVKISESSSVVVRLVNSTLYDAFRIQRGGLA